MCNFQQFSTDQVFGKETVHFDARRCEELTFPPFKLNFAMHFNVLKEIGKGTEGKVSKCSSKFSEYTCAIKETIPSHLQIPSTNSEPSDVSILAELNHPNVVKLHHAWNEKGTDCFGDSVDIIFTSMKFYDRTLLTYLMRNSRIDLGTINNIFRQMMLGLEHMHLHHIVHHDLKPDNILMDSDLTIMISDFGTAMRKESPNSKLKPGVIGSLPYCAPEVSNYHELHDEKADIFPAGVIYFELYIPVAAHRKRKVNEMSRLSRQAMASWESWTDFDLDSALEGTDLLDDWGGDYSLLKLMLHPTGSERPSASDILARLPVTDTAEDLRRN
ncbi:interferon-induced, double-stranded RNA-activated protein kinase-like [Lolium rigidum]|uniref:interferon-induced, double-stranded RNA-activated protein kinase-like n=1 Tax=Lolium rigidum TaxID=89674 RepID=UPI001F5DD00D|nr:interferon-induced, double-stranded RNA-activated protein kinase-like [Lolium rigidum]XP_047052458.1 interferon-induced, double-stranded RNA-activated protein kinase-like [Lolium rigidum]